MLIYLPYQIVHITVEMSFNFFHIHQDSASSVQYAHRLAHARYSLPNLPSNSAPVTPISRNSLQPIKCNRRLLNDFNSSPLPPRKRICLSPPPVPLATAPFGDSAAKPSTKALPTLIKRDATLQEATMAIKKRRGRPPKDKILSTMLQEAPMTTKKRRGRPSRNITQLLTKKMDQKKEEPKRKLVHEMEAAKSIRFGTKKDREIFERRDKKYRHARQCARALRKNDTPPTSLLSNFTASPPAFPKSCVQCRRSKSSSQFVPSECGEEYHDVCLHCFTDDNNDLNETQWCWIGCHEALCSDFFFNDQTYNFCKNCNETQHPIGLSSASVSPSDNLDDPAVSPEDWKTINNFYEKFDQMRRTQCNVCNEVGFEMQIHEFQGQSICARCKRDAKAHPGEVSLWGADNDMDPHPVPDHLPSLTIAEELLITRAHVLVNCCRVKGCQYKYSGHVISFMQNTAKVINRLPSLPSELQVVMLKPSSKGAKNSATHRTFERDFQVHRDNVETWLKYLIEHHPDYRNLNIDMK